MKSPGLEQIRAFLMNKNGLLDMRLFSSDDLDLGRAANHQDVEAFRQIMDQSQDDNLPRRGNEDANKLPPVHQPVRVAQNNLVTAPEYKGGGLAQQSTSVDSVCNIVKRAYLEKCDQGVSKVHMDLEDDVLPRTTLSISEQEGRVLVTFKSENPESRQRLHDGGPALAEKIACALPKDVLLKVAKRSVDDADTREYSADAPAALGNADQGKI
jgi:hypothetical protein